MTRNIILILISSVFVLLSCTEDLDVDFKGKSTNKLVVDGQITTDTMAHKVILSRTIDNGSVNLFETGADVTISDGSNIYQLREVMPGQYITDSSVYGVLGNTYTLEIHTKNNELYEASSKLNPISNIDSIKLKKAHDDFSDIDYYKVLFFGKEPAELGQFYMWNLYINDSLFNDTINETRFESDMGVNGEYLSEFEVYYIVNEDDVKDSTSLVLEMLSIPEDYYWYLFEVMFETTWRGSPWDPIPANVSTNISNGGAGFFRAMAITQQRVVYIKSQEEE